MKNRVITYLLPFFIFVSGCAHVISKDLRANVDPSLSFGEVLQNPEAYKGKIVLWGGGVIQTLPQEDGTTFIEVLEWPLGWRGEPRRTVPFQGKFLILVKEPLDSFPYGSRAKITVVGEIDGTILGGKVKSVSDPTYQYPLLLSKEIHVWKHYSEYSSPYDPRRDDPSYDPHRGAGILRY
jgi:outer membrane lipoprotein